MERCCVKGCDSHHKCNEAKNISYFQFPLHDENLLKKWLRQIDVLNWKPSSAQRICSLHFQEQDLAGYPDKNESYLKLSSIPTIFPSQPVEIIEPKEKNNICPTISLHSDLCLGKIVNVIGSNGTAPLLQTTRPLILIPSQQLLMHCPMEIITQNANKKYVNDSSKHISYEYIKGIGAENCHILLHNSVNYIKQMQKEKSLTDEWRHIEHTDTENSLQILNNGLQQINVKCQNENIAQASMGYASQVVALQTSRVFNDKKYIKQEKLEAAQSLAPQMPDWQPRLRKILPKPQSFFNPNTLPDAVRILPKCGSKSMTTSIPKPDILIVPRNEAGKTTYFRYPGNKRPILRITIDKQTTTTSDHQAGKRCLRSNAKIKIDSMENSLQREMTIENSSTNKAVTFKLDSITGEIIVSTRQLGDISTRDDSALKLTKTERKVHDNTISSAPKLRQLYIKGQQECIVLRKRLRSLRQRHKQEQEEIEKLQQHLTELGNKVENTCSQESPAPPQTTMTTSSLSCKRKERENSSIQLDEYKSLLRQVKKIKHELQTDVVIRQTRRFTENNQPGVNRDNLASIFPKVVKSFTADRKFQRKKNS